MATPSYTRSGARRAGDDYQDIIALEFMVEWLEHPDRYIWMEFESTEAGSLDDIVALQRDNTLLTRQVKFSTDSTDKDDTWDWDDLLETRQGAKNKQLPSLFQKWATSFRDLDNSGTRCGDAALVTNRRAAPGVASALTLNGTVDVAKVPDATFRRMVAQLGGDETLVRDFLTRFRFLFDRPGLDVLEEAVRRRFTALGGTDSGWFHLSAEMRQWVCLKNVPAPSGRITIRDVYAAADWHQLRPLPQDFAIPVDYVLPSKEFHATLERDILSRHHECYVIAAPPGVGKSTYMSYLFRKLKRQHPVVRHHYFLSLRDRDSAWRLDHHRAAESLMHDLLQDYRDAVGHLADDNPNPSHLGKWIEACGQYFARRGQVLTILIDGLDHVWREKRSVEELTQLFEHLLPAPPGVVIVIATQPIDDSQLPPMLRRAAPREEWRNLPLLDRAATKLWLSRHRRDVMLTIGRTMFRRTLDDLSGAFFERSQGHPLHLHYTLRAIQEQKLTLGASTVRSLPACSHNDVTNYYRELVAGLAEPSREILHILAACRFPWPVDGLMACLSGSSQNGVEFIDAQRQVRHLLVQDDLGLRPFHSSLLAFVEGLGEHAAYAPRMRARAMNWLRNDAPEYWRWAYAWLIEAQLGDDEDLREGPTRGWAVEALAKRQSREEIDDILRRSTWANLTPEHLPRAVSVGLLRDYCSRTSDPPERDVIERMLPVQLVLREDPHLDARLRATLGTLRDTEVSDLAAASAANGDRRTVEQCFAELRMRWPRTRQVTEVREWLDAYIQCATLPGGLSADQVLDLVKANQTTGYALQILRVWAESLARRHDVPGARALLNSLSALQEGERRAVLPSLVPLAVEEGVDVSAQLSAMTSQTSWLHIYRHLGARSSESAPDGSAMFPNVQLFGYDAHLDYETRDATVASSFQEVFYACLANHLAGNSMQTTDWLTGLTSTVWWSRVAHTYNRMAEQAARMLSAKIPADPKALLGELRGLERPEFGIDDGREAFFNGHVRAVCLATCSIFVTVSRLLIATGRMQGVGRQDIEAAASLWCCHPPDLINEYNNQATLILEANALDWLLQHEDAAIRASEDSFAERASRHVSLATLSARHDRKQQAQAHIRQACEHLVAHGYHKDVLLFSVLDVVESCGKAGIGHPRAWASSLAPAIGSIRSFTDGDETRHLPIELAGVLCIVAPELVGPYYESQCEAEDHYDAQLTLRALIQQFDLTRPFNQALARTVVDKDNLLALEARAQAGDLGSQSAIASLKEYLGPRATSWPSDDSRQSTYAPHTGKDEAMPKPDEFPPERFEELVRHPAVRTSYDREDLVRAWFAHWNNVAVRRADACQALLDGANKGLLGRCFDELYEASVSVNGRSLAFQWLVRAQAEDHGWDSFWSDRKRADRRFEEVRRYYPNKWFEFLKGSLDRDDGAELRSGYLSHTRFARIVSFLLLMKQEELAARCAEQMVAGALELLSQLDIQPPTWMISGANAEEATLSMLLSRLAWPSVLVRERACVAVGELLKDDPGGRVHAVLVAWTERQQLETVKSQGLLALAQGGIRWPTNHAAPVTDLLSPLVVSASAPARPDELSHSGSAPSDFAVNSFFRRHVRNFLPPAYATRADTIERKGGRGFWRQWGYEWAELCKRVRVDVATESLRYWASRETEHCIVDVMLSDVYRSSYLRALAWAASSGRLSMDAATFLAAQTYPVDLALWRVKPGRRPAWWPAVSQDEGVIDTVPAKIWQCVEALWEGEQADISDQRLVHASGFVWESADGNVIYDLDIRGVFQRCRGPEAPEPGEVAEALSAVSGSAGGTRSILHFDGVLEDKPVNEVADRLADWDVAPAAIRVDGVTVPRWQWWRMRRGVWLPPSFLVGKPCTVTCEDSGVTLRDGTVPVGQWSDWTDGLRERVCGSEVLPFSGGFLMAQRCLIDRFARSSKAFFCWAVRVRCFHRRHAYEDYEVIETDRVFGSTSIVIIAGEDE